MAREDAEALRRRLYAPGADAADVERFRAAGGVAPAPRVPASARVRRAAPEVEVRPVPVRPPEPLPLDAEPSAPGASDAPRGGPRGRGLLVVAIVAVLAAGGLVAVRLALPPTSNAPSATPVAVDAADRAAFDENLVIGNAAGIAAFLVTHRRPLPAIADATRYFTVEEHGTGEGLVTLSPVSSAAIEGRATVVLVVDAPARVGWRSLRRQVDSSGEQRYTTQVERAGQQEPGVPTTHTYRYARGDRPVELRIDVPDGVRWGAAVVFTD
ncbi:hypothetical protein [Amnibacterium setariae]|uniref:Uncharacterized protein n=1 Tax=Amnibacterium setariae TaxID=2306585 RepID=A0A3A1TW16_9MICO|nr:hypothetical protein [Amnibacterium setariae]RIX27788.1 hypothetical protein D1781_09610 [Amnibacterium setariae]